MIDVEVQELLKKGAIQEVSLSDRAFYSRLYLVPKKEGTYRPVIDLSSLNRFVPHVHFQTEGLHCLKTVLRKGDPMTSIDLKDAYFSVAPLHLRALQILLIQTLRDHQFDYNCPVFLNPQSRAELTWWLNNLPKVNGSPVSPPPPNLTILSDASMQGWRATCQGKSTNGKWFSQESIQHINLLVLKAAFLALKTFLKDQSHKVVLLKLDNSTAVAYLNNKGGTHSVPLMSLTLEIWTWCLQRNILISAQHVPGKENTVADSESLTSLDSTDWQLDPTVITPFLTNWNTDLFASRLTAQPRQYLKAYESAWSRWSRWCAKGKINPISAPLSKILDFLANAFSDGLVYRSINVLSSAISSTHSRIDNFLVGQHPHVTKLIKGVLNSCPPKPRYSYTWDVKKTTAIRRSCFLPYFSKKAWQP